MLWFYGSIVSSISLIFFRISFFNTSKTARLINYVKKLTLRDTNTTKTDKVGLQPWTIFLRFFQSCSFACILAIFLADKVSSGVLRKLTALSLVVLCLFYVCTFFNTRTS